MIGINRRGCEFPNGVKKKIVSKCISIFSIVNDIIEYLLHKAFSPLCHEYLECAQNLELCFYDD